MLNKFKFSQNTYTYKPMAKYYLNTRILFVIYLLRHYFVKKICYYILIKGFYYLRFISFYLFLFFNAYFSDCKEVLKRF